MRKPKMRCYGGINLEALLTKHQYNASDEMLALVTNLATAVAFFDTAKNFERGYWKEQIQDIAQKMKRAKVKY